MKPETKLEAFKEKAAMVLIGIMVVAAFMILAIPMIVIGTVMHGFDQWKFRFRQ